MKSSSGLLGAGNVGGRSRRIALTVPRRLHRPFLSSAFYIRPSIFPIPTSEPGHITQFVAARAILESGYLPRETEQFDHVKRYSINRPSHWVSQSWLMNCKILILIMIFYTLHSALPCRIWRRSCLIDVSPFTWLPVGYRACQESGLNRRAVGVRLVSPFRPIRLMGLKTTREALHESGAADGSL